MTKRMEDGGRSKVVSAARAIFLQKGFHQTSMAELSDRADVSVGQIYRLFRNKGEMIAAIIQEDTNARIASLAALRDDVSRGSLTAHQAFQRAALEALEGGQEALTFEILAEGFHNPFVGDVIGMLCERYRAMLSEIIVSACADITGSKLLAAEEMLLAILFGLGNRSLSRPPLSAEDTAHYAADMIVAMLKP